MGDEETIIEVKKVHFAYTMGKIQVPALTNISLAVPRAALVTFSGPSGSGKSTLLSLLGLIEPIQKGDIIFDGKSYKSLSNREKNEIRRYNIGFIFQDFHLIPVLTVEENVAYFLRSQGLEKKLIEERVHETLTAVGLWAHRKKRPNQLSGGQQQRVAIARALAKRPRVILGDEPTANLDQKTGREIMKIFSELAKKHGITVILSTHDEMVKSFAEASFEVRDGQLIEGEKK